MSVKIMRKSKVSVNNVISSDEDIDSDDHQIHEELDDDNNDISGNESEDIDLEDADGGGNSGWADAISKVLSVKPKTKSIILSKAKKDRDLKRRTDDQNDVLELVKSDGTVAESSHKKQKTNKSNESIDKKKKKKTKLSKNEWEVMHKSKPKEEDKERERKLCSIATKGVVQLFNAVREQQKTIETKVKEVGASETKRDKVLSQFSKNQFLDKLKQMDNKSDKGNKNTDSQTKQSDEQKWKVLRDDFMIGAKMKDWDKQSDSDEESND